MNFSVTRRCSAGVTSNRALPSSEILCLAQVASCRHAAAVRPHGLGDGFERHLEDVMQDQGDPLSRGEPLQHYQQRQMDAVIETDPVRRIGQLRLGRRRGGFDLAGIMGPLAAQPRGSDLVQAQAAGHHDQPAALIVDLTGTSAQQARKCVLNNILCGADIPEHPER